mgnify:CR=1 FL=1|jgi:DNA-binding transcriptional regulator YdaS (Cro superfamily)
MSAISRAIEYFGSRTEFAAAIGASEQAVSFWATGKRGVSAEYAVEIERATKGAVRCEELCPSVDWSFLRRRAKAV